MVMAPLRIGKVNLAKCNKTGNIQIQFYVSGPQGRKQVRKTAPVQTRTAARQYAEQLKASILAGEFDPFTHRGVPGKRPQGSTEEPVRVPPEGTPRTFRDLGERYLMAVRSDLADNTYKERRYDFDNHLYPFFGEVKLTSISYEMVQLFKGEQDRKGYGRRTINKHLTVFVTLLNFAVDNGWLNRIPKVKRFSVPQQTPEVPTKEEIETLIQAAEPGLRDLIILAVNTGMRRAELRGLKWSSVDFDQGRIYVENQLDAKGNDAPVKNREANRDSLWVPMTARAREALQGIARNPQSPYVFALHGAKPIHYKTMERHLKRLCERCDIHVKGWHTFRHYLLSTLASDPSVPPATVQRWARHRSFDSTQVYIHPQTDSLTAATSALD